MAIVLFLVLVCVALQTHFLGRINKKLDAVVAALDTANKRTSTLTE